MTNLLSATQNPWGVAFFAIFINIIIKISVALAVWLLTYLISKKIVVQALHKLVKKTPYQWDDVLAECRVFEKFAHVLPAVALYYVFVWWFQSPMLVVFSQIYLIFAVLLGTSTLLDAVVILYNKLKISEKFPIKVFVQVIKIILWITAIILTISTLLGKNPVYLLGGLGAMTAVLLLIFKDSILGLVAGIQISSNDMVRLGDWVEMPKHGADGDVIDISLTTVKIQNFDKTITTIPTYTMVSDSFKNWRGMSQSAGRRIKRNINIDMRSVKFCDESMLERFASFRHISEYIARKKDELIKFNAENGIDDSVLVNGRRMTNLGTFRAYLEGYLRNHPKINKDMTFLVRQLQPTETGLPIEIYVFCSDKIWANYEAVQADIFDHILAVIPEFDLKVFQNPTGADFEKLG